MLCAAAGPVQPYVGLAGRRLPGFLQYLQCRLIAMENVLPAELPVQHLIDGPQPGIRDIQQPVGHGLPGELQFLAVKLLLQPVLEMLASLNAMHKKQERLIEITADGQITDDEIQDFIHIQEELEKISITVETLQLWSEQMLANGSIDIEAYNAAKSK